MLTHSTCMCGLFICMTFGATRLPQGDAGLQAELLQRAEAGNLLANQARQEPQLRCTQTPPILYVCFGTNLSLTLPIR